MTRRHDCQETRMLGRTLRERYTITGVAGRGSFGEVYKARDKNLKIDVAVKTLLPRDANDEEAIRRLEAEAMKLAALSHPGIVRVLEFVREGDFCGIVMEYVGGETLSAYLKKNRRLDYEEIRQKAIEMAQALGSAHKDGIVHRDIKPGNILIDAHGKLRLTDFGLAKRQQDFGVGDGTAKGIVVGTPKYMSPEQCEGKDLTPASDVYSLGVVLYQMVTRHLPVNGQSQEDYLRAHPNEIPVEIARYAPRLPGEFAKVIMRCIEKRPNDRWPTALNLADALEQLAPVSRSPQNYYRPMLIGGMCVVALLVTGLVAYGTYAFTRSSLPDPKGEERSPLSVEHATGPVRMPKYVEVELGGRKTQARYHNLTNDKNEVLVSIDGAFHVVPLEDVLGFERMRVRGSVASQGRP